jgi:Flp pilus assembly pilin Flp
MKTSPIRSAFATDVRGASAVEFALIAPVLALALMGLAEMGYVVYQRAMHIGALRAGGQYVLNGGRDLDVTRDISMRSWSSRPEDGVVETSRFCLCGEAEHVCNEPCSDDSVPLVYISIQSHATLGGVIVDFGEAANDAVRIR